MPQSDAPPRRTSHSGLWLWAALAALAVFARSRVGVGYHPGNVAALALMASASFLILINQRGMPQAAESEPER